MDHPQRELPEPRITDEAQRGHEAHRHPDPEPSEGGRPHEVCLSEAAAPAGFTTEVVLMMMQLSLRGAAIVKLQGVCWPHTPLARALEEAYLTAPYCDWAKRGPSAR